MRAALLETNKNKHSDCLELASVRTLPYFTQGRRFAFFCYFIYRFQKSGKKSFWKCGTLTFTGQFTGHVRWLQHACFLPTSQCLFNAHVQHSPHVVQQLKNSKRNDTVISETAKPLTEDFSVETFQMNSCSERLCLNTEVTRELGGKYKKGSVWWETTNWSWRRSKPGTTRWSVEDP